MVHPHSIFRLVFMSFMAYLRCSSRSSKAGKAGKAHPLFGSIEIELESRVFQVVKSLPSSKGCPSRL